MKFKHVVIILSLSGFALVSSAASAETYHFGEGQSSLSGGSAKHHASKPKHRKNAKARNNAS